MIGSCVAERLVQHYRERMPSVVFDFILFNNLAELPAAPPAPMSQYDFQCVILPLRHIVSDSVIRFKDFASEPNNTKIIDMSRQMLRLMLEASLKYNKEHGIVTFVSNFVVPQMSAFAGLDNLQQNYDLRHLVNTLNEDLYSLITSYTNVYLVDFENIASSMGKRYFLDDLFGFTTHNSFWYPDWHLHEGKRIEPLPPIEDISPSHLYQFLEATWRAIDYNYRVVNQIDMVKLVIFDLDDTLWRGLIGEHYTDITHHPHPHGWPLGIHECLQYLRSRGILVAICSKNNPELVQDRWERAIPLTWITLDDFVSREIGWSPKAEGVQHIMSDVNVTAKSVVFVDDNPVERESIKAQFPGIRVIGANPFHTRRILLNAPETQVRSVTKESSQREAMIRKQIDRESERQTLSREDFLLGLDCRIELFRVPGQADPRFGRTFELLNKTNQFNTTGKRWTLDAVHQFLAQGGEIFSFIVKDKFTSYGLVGVILAKHPEIVQFVMSCRVIGLEIETSVLQALMQHWHAQKLAGPILGTVIKNESNRPCQDVFLRSGFVVDAQDPTRFVYPHDKPSQIAPHLQFSTTELNKTM
jgi:FkbH-like protein